MVLRMLVWEACERHSVHGGSFPRVDRRHWADRVSYPTRQRSYDLHHARHDARPSPLCWQRWFLQQYRQGSLYRWICHTADADATQLSSGVASALAVWTEFATSSRRLPTDSVDNLETDQTDSILVWLREFWLIDIDKSFNNDAITSSLVTNNTGNCKLGHDCRRVRSHCRHDSTRLRCWQICSESSRLSPNSCEFRSRHQLLSRVGVGGVYWALSSFKLLC